MITSETPIPSPITSSSAFQNSSPGISKLTRSQKRKLPKKDTNIIKKRKHVLRKLLVFMWKKNQPFLHKVNNFERNDQEMPNDLSKSLTPLDYFEKFLTRDDILHIVDQTNLYSTQCSGKSTNLSMEDLKNFLAIKM